MEFVVFEVWVCFVVLLVWGLGSSVMVIVVGLMGVNVFVGEFFFKEKLFEFVIDIEGYFDNVVFFFLGGFCMIVKVVF